MLVVTAKYKNKQPYWQCPYCGYQEDLQEADIELMSNEPEQYCKCLFPTVSEKQRNSELMKQFITHVPIAPKEANFEPHCFKLEFERPLTKLVKRMNNEQKNNQN